MNGRKVKKTVPLDGPARLSSLSRLCLRLEAMLHCVRTILNAIWVDDKKDDECATTGRMNDSEPYGSVATYPLPLLLMQKRARNRVCECTRVIFQFE